MDTSIGPVIPEAYSAMLNSIRNPAFLVRGGEVIFRNVEADPAEAAVTALLAEQALVPGAFVQRDGWEISAQKCGEDMLVNAVFSAKRTALMASAANAIRTPVSELYASLTALDTILADNEESREELAKLHRGIYQLVRAQGNIDTVVGGETKLHTTVEDLPRLVERVCANAAHAARIRGMEIDLELPREPLRIRMDAMQVERALLNLLSNAIAYGIRGEEISVRVHTVRSHAVVEIVNQSEEESDTWECITGTPERLGLMVTRMIARAHGGVVLSERKGSIHSVRMTLSMNEEVLNLAAEDLPLIDYAGGFNHTLLELSGVLPGEDYDPRGL
ncbi:MAG: HAMP domain-containing histidine kinase [Oscillospiraceae bacterium]|nr:HAMP domain-containing histidine kinase [Oscillospiraceae bacterium]